MTERVTIGLDVGGTKVAGGLVTRGAAVLEVVRRSSLVDGRRDPGSMVTLDLARELLERAGALGLAVDGIGAGFPEYVDPHGRLTSHEVLAWTRQPWEALGALGTVTIDSDVRCAALGEAVHGVGRGLPDFVYVGVGTGLSYCFVEGSRIRRGRRGEAIGFGELEVSCTVAGGRDVSLEQFASGEAIRQRYVLETGRPAMGAEDVMRAAAAGDGPAAMIVASAGQALGAGLAMLVRLLDPTAIVLGGGLAAAGDPWRAALDAAYAGRSRPRPAPPPIIRGILGESAGIIGAALAHRERIARGPPT